MWILSPIVRGVIKANGATGSVNGVTGANVDANGVIVGANGVTGNANGVIGGVTGVIGDANGVTGGANGVTGGANGFCVVDWLSSNGSLRLSLNRSPKLGIGFSREMFTGGLPGSRTKMMLPIFSKLSKKFQFWEFFLQLRVKIQF